MLRLRDDILQSLLAKLPSCSDWFSSDQAMFFASTLFPNIDIVDALGQSPKSKWDRYLELRPQIIDLEASLADDFFSHELLGELRFLNLSSALDTQQKFVVSGIRAQIIHRMLYGSFSSSRLLEILSYIRRFPDSFSLWFQSTAAERFNPPVFSNSKHSSGYFF